VLIVYCSLREGPLANRSQPLTGKTVVVTRAPEQSQDLADALESLGATVLLLPTVSFVPSEDTEPLDSALRRLPQFDWILFTSQNSVRFLFQQVCRMDKKRSAQPPRPLVAAVGAATAQAARNLDIRVDYVAQKQTGESLAAELSSVMSGARVLLPRSDRADERLPAALREAGAKVEEVIAYHTTMPESFDPAILRSIHETRADVILFASPSAFENFSIAIAPMKVEELSSQVNIAAIGATTARAIREAGVNLVIESNESSADGMANAIAAYYEKFSPTARHA